MPESELQQALRRIFALWNDTEARIKEAERLRAEVVIPSIKELRYAGRWLIDVLGITIPLVEDNLTPEQRATLDRALFETEQNCVRAKNDAVDASVLFLHRRLEQMVTEFGVPIVYSYFPNYADIRRQIREVDEIITNSRGPARVNRNELYDRLATEHLPHLIIIYQTMLASEDLIQRSINETTQREATREWRDTFRTWGGYIIGIIGIIVGVAGVAVAFIH